MASVWRNTDSLASGFYEKEEEITFNVLDKVSIDPIEYPQPEFSLHWTSESAERVQAFMDRQLSKEEVDRAVEQWGTWFDENGKVTAFGRYMLPAFGVHPTDNGEQAGYLGIQVRLGENSNFEITSAEPGYPASRAGLAVGDLLSEDFSAPLYTPKEYDRRVRAAGAGTPWKLNAYKDGQWHEVTVTLDAAPGDSWDSVESRDIMERIMRASGIDVSPRDAQEARAFRDYEQSVRYVAGMTTPDEKIFVGSTRHDRVCYADPLFYFLSDRADGVRDVEMYRGVVTGEGAQWEIIRELGSNKVRVVVLREFFDAFCTQPNASSTASGSKVLNEYIRAHYKLDRRFGGDSVWVLSK